MFLFVSIDFEECFLLPSGKQANTFSESYCSKPRSNKPSEQKDFEENKPVIQQLVIHPLYSQRSISFIHNW